MAPGGASNDLMAKVSTEASTSFVADYYYSLNSRRKNIAAFYIPPSSMQGDKPIPTIIYNGSVKRDGQVVQAMFENEMPPTRFEAQSIDCHILNPSYNPPGIPVPRSPAGAMTLLVTVSGSVRFGEDRADPERQFSEAFVLVPSHDRSSTSSRPKEFLIQSQNFRMVV